MAAVHPVLEAIREMLSAPLAGRAAEDVARHPAGDAGRWSAQQVVAHLEATWRLTTKGVEDRLQKGRPLKTRPTLRQRALQWMICEAGYFPRGVSAPEFVRPAEGAPLTGDALIVELTATLATMDAALARIEREAQGARVLNQGLLGPLSVAQWRRFHRTHARHHVRQMVRALG